MIEVSKDEESGHGDILSREFIEWRSRKMETGGLDILNADLAANIAS